MRTTVTLLCLLCWNAPALAASQPNNDNQPALEPLVEGQAHPAIEAEAVEAPKDGVWRWVKELDGEVPTDAQVEAMEELEAEARDELALIEHLSPSAPPTAYYDDPTKVLYVDPLFLDQVDPSEFDIPVEVNDDVRKWVAYFTGPGRKYYTKWLGRSSRYRPMMYAELEKAGLPRDLVYLSMIESGYNTHAYSHAAAAGLWQFISSTGRMYRLRVDWWVDERRDPEKATKAAIQFLGELNKMFDGDWYLAWASYNTGPGRVRRAISRSGSRDFWKISAGPYLASETDNYVPKIIAAAIIGKHPERYGFTDISFQEQLTYDEVKVDHAVDVEILAKCSGLSVKEFKLLNPALRRHASPTDGLELRVPVGKQSDFVAALDGIPRSKHLTITHHKVRKGETLSKIAQKYGVSTSAISRANRLKNANRIYVGMTLVVPRNGAPVPTQVASRSSRSTSDAKRSTPSTYTVRRGDTLSEIATKYGTTTASIRSLNGISGSTIRVGQTLKLQGRASSSSSGSTKRYTIRRGDTLSGIAQKHGVKQSDLQRWNGIKNASSIRVGQTLTIRGGSSKSSSSWTKYTVRSGDNLGKIAEKYNVSVSSLKSWNGLNSSVIHPGQTLKIRR